MYAVAPAIFLVFNINPIRGLGLETLAYALPHILISTYANYITYKHVRFSFWNEIYEFAMSFHAGLVTLLALINPKLGSFNVTDKGISVTKRTFDWDSARGLVITGALVTAAIAAVPLRLHFQKEDTEAILVNLVWSLFNLILIFSALLVAFEQPQLRRSHRLERKLTAIVYSEDLTLNGMTDNVSESGCQVIINSWSNLLSRVELELIGDYGARAFVTAEVIRAVPLNESQTILSLEFVEPSRAQLDDLNRVIYSDVREWYSQQRDSVDDPMESFKFIASSVTRSFRKREAAVVNAKLRKPIHAYAQVYWQGHLYPAVATEMGHRSLQVEMETGVLDDRNPLSRSQPVGLLLSQAVNEPLPKRLLAQVEAVTPVSDMRGNRLILELAFPEKIMKRQGNNIKHLLKTLN